jgi:hypothetical protein
MGDIHFLNDEDEANAVLAEKMAELVDQINAREIECMLTIGWKKDDPEVFIRMVPCENLNSVTRMIGMIEIIKNMLLNEPTGEEE